jgi:hypothetical protein
MKSLSYVQVEAVDSEAVVSEAILKGRQRLANTSRWSIYTVVMKRLPFNCPCENLVPHCFRLMDLQSRQR